ncbi:MAG: ABC transporter substrate-binding protein [Syntrophobacteraceae bacterium]
MFIENERNPRFWGFIPYSAAWILILVTFVTVSVPYVYAETVSIEDKLGRHIEVRTPVKRAVFLSLYEFIPVLGVWDRVVGANRWAFDHAALKHTLEQRKIPSVGTGNDVGIEAILGLQPDLVLLWSYRPEIAEFLSARGLKVIAIYPDSLEELYDALDLCGRLFSVESKAKEVRSLMEEMLQMVQSRVATLASEQKRKVLWVWQEPTRVSGSRGLQQDLTRLIGAVNPAEAFNTRYANVSLEQIVAWNPDDIFIWGHARYKAESLLANAQWKSIKAVKDGRVFKAPKVDTWSPSVVLLTLWTAQKTYPECFAGMPLREIAAAYYSKCFGMPLDAAFDQELQ